MNSNLYPPNFANFSIITMKIRQFQVYERNFTGKKRDSIPCVVIP